MFSVEFRELVVFQQLEGIQRNVDVHPYGQNQAQKFFAQLQKFAANCHGDQSPVTGLPVIHKDI